MPAPYPFQYHRTLPSDAILKPALVNSFDLLLIGGGGLLSHPHDPLTDPKWQAMVQVPVALIGVGAEESVAGKSEILLKKSAYISGRDEQSVAALGHFAREVYFIPDPVLSDVTYFKNEMSRHIGTGKRRLWILKHLNTPSFRTLCDHILRNKDDVCFLEPHLDFGITVHIPRAKPIYSTDDLFSMMDKTDIVLSMRYHGCILAMLRGKAALGFVEMKSLALLKRYQQRITIFFRSYLSF
jgi:polysaccharide pyruvyl transferase WcaK-like protein